MVSVRLSLFPKPNSSLLLILMPSTIYVAPEVQEGYFIQDFTHLLKIIGQGSPLHGVVVKSIAPTRVGFESS
jgi:hypothetical protein